MLHLHATHESENSKSTGIKTENLQRSNLGATELSQQSSSKSTVKVKFSGQDFVHSCRSTYGQPAEKWKAMSEEDKKQYIDAAKVTPVDMPTDSWGEVHKILRNIQKSVCGVYI